MIMKTNLIEFDKKETIDHLIECCNQHDSQTLSYPFEEADAHYLLFRENQQLAAILAMVGIGDDLVECCAFTLPKARRQGCFSALLAEALKDFDACDILFGCEPNCTAAIAVLKHLSAELEGNEYQMQYDFDEQMPLCDSSLSHTNIRLTDDSFVSASKTRYWNFYSNNLLIGSCQTTNITPHQVFLHQVLISPEYQGQGYGRDLILLLLKQLPAHMVTTILLQVSGNNPAAFSLYQKTGFRITRTLSYYCY